jgi:hypothetical protein
MEIEGTIRAMEPYFDGPEHKILLRVTLDPRVADFADKLIGRRVRLVVEEEPVGSVTATCGYVPPSMTFSFEGNTWVAEGPVPGSSPVVVLSGGPFDGRTFYCPKDDALALAAQAGPALYRSTGRRLPSSERIFVYVEPVPIRPTGLLLMQAMRELAASESEGDDREPPVNVPDAAPEGSWMTRKSLL